MVLREAAKAKINLTLAVTGRRADGYHTLESLVAFADAVCDELTLTPGDALGLTVAGAGADAAGPVADNLVMKAARALLVEKSGLRAGHFRLVKSIPVAAGLGGGSADAAAALRLLARLNDLPADDAAILTAARATGADVPVCLRSRACVMRGIGERVGPPVELGALHALLVNPRLACPTPAVFRALGLPAGPPRPDEPDDAIARGWRARGNDLQKPAQACLPAIGDVLAALASLPSCAHVRMSGSGATCMGFFDSAAACAAAGAQLAALRPGWWIAPARLD